MLEIKDVTVNEDAGSVIFGVTFSKAWMAGNVDVHYATADGTATQRGDYRATSICP